MIHVKTMDEFHALSDEDKKKVIHFIIVSYFIAGAVTIDAGDLLSGTPEFREIFDSESQQLRNPVEVNDNILPEISVIAFQTAFNRTK